MGMPSMKFGSSLKRPCGSIMPGEVAGDQGIFMGATFGVAGPDLTLAAGLERNVLLAGLVCFDMIGV